MHEAENLSGVTEFISGQWRMISSYWMKKYEEAKARLMALVGEFLAKRQQLLQMGRRIAYLQNKAEKTGNASLRRLALDLENQRKALLDEQVTYEGRLQAAMEKIRMIDRSQAASSGVGADPVVTPTVILGVAAAVAVVAGLLLYHNKKVNYLHRLLTDVENKVLTPAEAQALAEQEGGGMFRDLPKGAGPYLIGGAVVVGLLIYSGSRRRS